MNLSEAANTSDQHLAEAPLDCTTPLYQPCLVSLPLPFHVSGVGSSVFVFFPLHATLVDIAKEPVRQGQHLEGASKAWQGKHDPGGVGFRSAGLAKRKEIRHFFCNRCQHAK